MPTRLSVILPVYNGMPHLPEAVESILTQTYTDFTLIIVNDGSTDGTRDYLRSLDDPRIEIIDQQNQGLGASLNFGLAQCHSEYVARMDADDVSHPNRFQEQVDYLDKHPHVVIVGTQIDFLIADIHQRAFPLPTEHAAILARLRRVSAGLCHPSLMFRADSARASGGYPSDMAGEDVEFCLRMCDVGGAANLDLVLFHYRLHEKQLSLVKCRQLIVKYRHLAHCIAGRSMGKPEPTLETFVRNSSGMARLMWSIETQAVIQYRKGRIKLAMGCPIEGITRLVLSGLYRPSSALLQVGHIISRRRVRPGS